MSASHMHEDDYHHHRTQHDASDCSSPDAVLHNNNNIATAASPPTVGLKCFMCGAVLGSEALLDKHVIQCARGHLKRSTEGSPPAAAVEGEEDGSKRSRGNDDCLQVGDVENASEGERQPTGLQRSVVPPALLPVSEDFSTTEEGNTPSAVVVRGDEERRSALEGDHGEECTQSGNSTPPAVEGGFVGVFAGEGSPEGTPAKQRRRRTHTAHDQETSEQRQRRHRLAEAMQSLEEMQQQNQERLRAVQLAVGAETFVDGPVNSGDFSQSGNGQNMLSASFSSSRKGVTFSRHHTAHEGGAAASSPKYEGLRGSFLSSPTGGTGGGAGSRDSLERSCSAVVMPSTSVTTIPGVRGSTTGHVSAAAPAGRRQVVGASAGHQHVDPAAPRTSTMVSRVQSGSGTAASRAMSTEGRNPTASPNALHRRSSTVAANKRSTTGGVTSSTRDVANSSASLNSSLEIPRSGPAPAPTRASTAVRQRTTALPNATGAVSTSTFSYTKSASLLPNHHLALHRPSSLNLSATSSGISSRGAAAGGATAATTAAPPPRVTRAAPVAPSAAAAGSSASHPASTFSNKSLIASRYQQTAPSSSVLQHSTSSSSMLSSKSSSIQLTMASGSVVVGGPVPQPKHSTLRRPKKAPSVSSAQSAASPPQGAATLNEETKAAAASASVGGTVAVGGGGASSPPSSSHRLMPPPTHRLSVSLQRSVTPERSVSAASPSPQHGGASAIFCAECGMKYVDKAKFCAFCGHRREQFREGS